MKFKVLKGPDVRIALLTGHVAIVGKEFEELDERFHKEAYASMCISEDMLKGQVSELHTHQAAAIVKMNTSKDRILEAIDTLVQSNNLKAFNAAGVPKAPELTKIIGKSVSSAQRDEAWYDYQQAQDK